MALAARDEPADATSSDLDLNAGMRPPGMVPRAAGVLVALLPGDRILLTKRASHLRHHPGQIAFPGGKVEDVDDGPVGASLREAAEEVALPPSSVEVLGTLPAHLTVTGFAMVPVLARVTGPFDPVPEAGEVDEIFSVPFAHVADPANYLVHSRPWRGTKRHYFVVPWGPYYIWGATARVLRGLADRLTALPNAGDPDAR